MRYIIYARKSSESEDRQVQSVDDQLSVLREFAERHSLTVVEELTEAHSAKAPGTRPVFAALLHRIEVGKVDAILCWSINRLSRNPVDSGTLSWMLQQRVLKSIRTAEREYLPEDNVLLMAVETGAANQYIVDLRKSVIRAQDEKAARGWWPFKPPPGYLTNRETHEIEIDPERFDLMRRAWDLMLTGAYTIPQVLEELRGWGYRHRRGNGNPGSPMARSRVYELFDMPFYYGWYRYKGELIQGKHRPMVTKEEFDRVQAFIHKDQHIQPKKHEFAFTGLIRCGVCGCLVTAERKVKHYPTTGNTRTYVYYHCTGNKGCPKESVTEEYIEGEIRSFLEECSILPEWERYVDAILDRFWREEPDWAKSLLTRHTSRLAELRTKLQRLYELRLGDELEKGEFLEQKNRYQEEIAATEAAIGRLEGQNQRGKETAANVLSYAATASSRFELGTARQKREVAVATGSQYVLTLGKLSIKAHPLLETIRTFEPPKTFRNMVQSGHLEAVHPGWRPLLDKMRTLLLTQDVSFPKLREQLQVAD